MQTDSLTKIENFSQKLNSHSPSLCLAKWYHVSLYLHLGTNHSCYHPEPHPISKTEVKKNPAALHNTEFKKQQREKMLKGERPAECSYCWKVEDLKKKGIFSDRVLKSEEQDRAGKKYLEQVLKSRPQKDFIPTAVEVSFSNLCNFKCAYCNPKASSTWQAEIQKYGPYKGVYNHYNIEKGTVLKEEENPFVEAWNKWWPSAQKEVHGLRITGGEPLLHKSTYKVLEGFLKKPAPHLELMINSNLGTPPRVFDKFVEQLKLLIKEKSLKKIKIYTSLESWGKKAEYMRFGLDIKLWERNFELLLKEVPEVEISIMSTFSSMCLTGFREFLQHILYYKKKYRDRSSRIEIDISHLVNPDNFLVTLLPRSYAQYFYDIIYLMEQNISETDITKFHPIELVKMRRVFEYFLRCREQNSSMLKHRTDFVRFWAEADRRRKTKFAKVFPELKEFWKLCEKSEKALDLFD